MTVEKPKILLWTLVVLSVFYRIQCAPIFQQDGVKIVTYGEPCIPPRKLPVTIEGPNAPVEKPKVPVKIEYRIVTETQKAPPTQLYPVEVEYPVPPPSRVEVDPIIPDPFRGKSYSYDIKNPPPPAPLPISKNYNFGVEIPPPPTPREGTPQSPQPVKLLTGLTSKVDRILIPACDAPKVESDCSCKGK